ncbi:hypothetical protein LGH82_22860 [Mesorhizobium sp. PAMC28654]|uniref:hypothetical protein n=1 Tax=Mesorhizobium sp. PAMC28654 TaxID=2880934 RepID=UPI001D0A1345|nr:hypothetical protein [Mesorhizobium sp. PAMC28654]UDL87982.1 hypothetical protein LGH82_22860 [Mesorhizobium sp. PAMC28654]
MLNQISNPNETPIDSIRSDFALGAENWTWTSDRNAVARILALTEQCRVEASAVLSKIGNLTAKAEAATTLDHLSSITW